MKEIVVGKRKIEKNIIWKGKNFNTSPDNIKILPTEKLIKGFMKKNWNKWLSIERDGDMAVVENVYPCNS